MDISPKNLQIYLHRHGWQLKAQALDEFGLYWFEHPTARPRQITFVSDEEAPDYQESLQLALIKLAEVVNEPLERVIENIQDADEDVLFFRLFGQEVNSQRLPFRFVPEAIAGCRNLLLAAAHSVLMPRLYHPRLGRREASDFLDETSFGQTAPGSFVFKVMCPVPEVLSLPSIPPIAPFSRQVTLALEASLRDLSRALRTDSLPQLIETENAKDAPMLSSNLCDALVHLQDEKLNNALDVSFLWALTMDAPGVAGGADAVRFKADDFKRIEIVRDELRSIGETSEDLYIGLVETLNGAMGNDGRRYGEVIFEVTSSPDEGWMRARLNLSPEDYAKADKAHMTDNSYALFSGKLEPGRQPRNMRDVKSIEWHIAGAA